MQIQIQEQRQEQRLQQTISAQQLLLSQLTELPIGQLAERIETELNDNPALEKSADDGNDMADSSLGVNADDYGGDATADEDEAFDQEREREERSDALDAALENIGRDDEDLPVYQGGRQQGDETEPMVYGEGKSFYDQLTEQVGEMELTDNERYVMEYIIRSLDDDGLLRTPLSDICEQLAIYHGIDISTGEAERILKRLQQLDPPGIGARSLQECLLLQVARRKPSSQRTLMERVLNDYFDEFTHKHWERIQQALALGDMEAEELMNELRRLNPKPGAAMGEAVGRSLEQITPDFIVDTHDDGTITLALNSGDVPRLEVSQSFADLMQSLQQNRDHITRQQKEALLYTKQKIEAAQSFIQAVNTRRDTLLKTMKAIIELQRPFFEEGDEDSLRPMILKDIAQITHQDLSTISRVTNSKYVQTRWGVFPLKYFFSDGYVTQDGEELSTRRVKSALRDIIDAEDKRHPMSDDALAEALAKQGMPIARRTVAKYREQMAIPVARLRRHSTK